MKNPQKRRKKWCVGPEKVVRKPCLWDRLILDLNRASQAIGYSIEHIRQMAKGLKALFDWSCT